MNEKNANRRFLAAIALIALAVFLSGSFLPREKARAQRISRVNNITRVSISLPAGDISTEPPLRR